MPERQMMYISITRGVLIMCDCICRCLCDMVGNFISVSCKHLEGLSERASDYCQIPVPQLYALLCLYEFLAQDKMTVIV